MVHELWSEGSQPRDPLKNKEATLVESAPLPSNTIRVRADDARRFVREVFVAAGFSSADAELVADVLVAADLRGVRSHGVARVGYFMVRVERGTLNPNPAFTMTMGASTTGLLDADNGLGIVASAVAMDRAIELAEEFGSGFIAVANSNHFGFAGYWAERAMERNCLGISMSNSARRVTPTFGDESLLGTNPLSVALGGGSAGTNFVLDMATSAVAVGKIETALREDRPVPESWVSRASGEPTLDDRGILSYDSPLLPLGGEGDESGGHKGFGLNLMVELVCGALSGTPLADRIAGATGQLPAAMCHFMGAIRLDGFRPSEDVHRSMGDTFGIVRGAKKSPGHDRIFIPGEPEQIARVENNNLGIPITRPVREDLERVAETYAIMVPW